MVATVGGCPFNGAKCSVRWAMFAAFLSVACAMPLSHMNNDDYINTISIKHSGPAVAAVCEAVAVDTVFFKTPSPPQCDLKDDPICDLSLRNHDEQWYKILDEGQQAYLRNLNAVDSQRGR